MNKLCKDVVRNLECWMCGSALEKMKGSVYYVIKCTNANCKSHVILVTQEELDRIEV